MKAVYILIGLMSFSSGILFGEIRNGYDKQIQATIASIQKLNSQLLLEGKKLSFFERQLIKGEIRELTEIISHYELTRQFINQFRIVSPVIYNELDSIKDKKKRITDVFVKLIPKDQSRIQLQAATIFIQSPFDSDASQSEYGANSVSVELWIGDNNLMLLSHEFGHIKYVVPNLANYITFYKKWYKRGVSDFSYFGHNRHDESGKTADIFEQRFRKDLASYLINGGKKFESTLTLIDRIRRNSSKHETTIHPEWSFAWSFARR